MFLRLLLALYPLSFRNEYGADMQSDLHRRLHEAGNPFAKSAVWIAFAADTLTNAAGAHADLLTQDMTYAWRKLRHAPGFALTVLALTALGIGATTAVFTIADHVLIRALPYPEPHRLVRLYENRPGYARMELSPPNYADFVQRSQSFESIGAYANLSVNLSGSGEPQRLDATTISAGALQALGVAPGWGRGFQQEDEKPGAPAVVILSHGLWRGVFGGSITAIGRKVLLNREPAIVIGIMPPHFQFPSREIALWVPLRLGPEDMADRTNNNYYAVGRLKQGVALAQARQELNGIAAGLEREHPRENVKLRATLNLVREELPSRTRTLLAALAGGAFCVLLIACTNLANLLLARAMSRQRELSVRAALGAGRERLVRQLLTESLLLALAGGVLGVGLAKLALPALLRLVPSTMPIPAPSMDARALLLALCLTVLTGLAFGVYPALRICRDAAAQGLREGGRTGSGPGREKLRSTLVVVEIAVSVVLLVCSGLLIRALNRVQSAHPGFHTEGVLTMRTALPMPQYENVAAREQFYSRVLDEVRSLPGVRQAAYISFLPMTMTGGIWPVGIGRVEVDRIEGRVASLRYITAGLFDALGIRILAGRQFTPADSQPSLPVAVVSQSFAGRFFPGVSPLGRQFHFAFKERTIVGVVNDIRVRGLESPSEPQVYLPSAQVDDRWLTFYAPRDLVVAASGDPMALAPAIGGIIRRVDPAQPISDVAPLSSVVEAGALPRKVQARVLGAFTLIAVLLACVGIQGLLSFVVSSRTREIGVRMAMGATPLHILTLVLRRTASLAALGVLAGALLAFWTGRSLESLLAGVKPHDSASFLTAIGVAAAMALIGSLPPVLRAVRVDAVKAIRAD